MADLGWHSNAWRGGARASVLAAPGPLLILNTALDTGIVAEWRAKTPARLLYRHVYQGSDPGDHDVQGRCDVLSREAEPLLPFGVSVLAPWNEERQDTPLLSAYADDTVRAVDILRARGFKVGVGNFGVCWPKPEDAHLFLPAIRVADFYSRHAYAAPTLTSDWDRLIGHAYADAQTVFSATGKHTLMTEFGIDWGVLGYQLSGWRSHGGMMATDYAYQLIGQAARAPACIDTLYIYDCGQFGDWQTFDVAGEPEIEKAVRLFSAQWGGIPVASDYPLAAWRPVGNYGYPTGAHGRQGHLPVGVVYHIMAGYLANVFPLFNSPASQASAHYGVGKTGPIEQYVAEADAAWHAGVWNKPNLGNRFLADAFAHSESPNIITIGVECEGFAGDVMPEAQYQAVLALSRSIFARNNWPVTDVDRFIGHYQIDSVNRPNDPGTGFPWQRLRADVAGKPAVDLTPELARLYALGTSLSQLVADIKVKVGA